MSTDTTYLENKYEALVERASQYKSIDINKYHTAEELEHAIDKVEEDINSQIDEL